VFGFKPYVYSDDIASEKSSLIGSNSYFTAETAIISLFHLFKVFTGAELKTVYGIVC